MKTFEITREPRYEGYDSLHGTRQDAPDEFLLLVDGQEIGGTYWCSYNPAVNPGWGWDDGGLPGESWASWGPRGLSCGHSSREAAERAQVREYAADPDRFDRLFAIERAEREAEAALRQAGQDAEYERRAAGRRRRHLGDDEPGPVIWTLPAFFALYADMEEVRAVSAWLEASGIEDVSSRHEVRVEQRATRRAAVFEKHAWVYNGRGTDRTETRVVTISADPPAIVTPDRPDLHAVFAEHWPAQFPLIDFGFSTACGKCTREAKAVTPDQMVPWPCTVVEKAIANGPAAEEGDLTSRVAAWAEAEGIASGEAAHDLADRLITAAGEDKAGAWLGDGEGSQALLDSARGLAALASLGDAGWAAENYWHGHGRRP